MFLNIFIFNLGFKSVCCKFFGLYRFLSLVFLYFYGFYICCKSGVRVIWRSFVKSGDGFGGFEKCYKI